MNILITGGAGYIGSHCVLELLKDKKIKKIIIVDNFSQGKKNILTNSRVEYCQLDITEKKKLNAAFKKNKIDAVMHFAALASVPDSVVRPLKYYQNNLIGGLNLLDCMVENKVNKIIFSSSAAVYGNPETNLIGEDHPKKPINPYGFSKFAFEQMLNDFHFAYGINSISFRYFCAAGSDPGLTVGENHTPESHVIPCLIETILGKRPKFYVFGKDYPTRDGSAIRDYIHVADLAAAHVKGLEYLSRHKSVCEAFNLGISRGYTVFELVKAVQKVSGKKLNFQVKGRRPGDPVSLVADAKRAKKVLGWMPKYGLEDMFETALKYLGKA